MEYFVTICLWKISLKVTKINFFLGGCHHIYLYWLFKIFLKIMLLVKLKFV